MADETEAPKKGLNIKTLIIGVVLFLVQLVAVYFILANVILKRVTEEAAKEVKKAKTEHRKEGDTTKAEGEGEGEGKGEGGAEAAKFFKTIDDIIINPAGTKGQRLLLISVGFDLPSEEEKKALEEKEVKVKDVIINTLSAKTIEELNQVGYKDTLKIELKKKLKKEVSDIKFSNIYFGKYILQ